MVDASLVAKRKTIGWSGEDWEAEIAIIVAVAMRNVGMWNVERVWMVERREDRNYRR